MTKNSFIAEVTFNAFESFSQTAYANDNMPNTVGDCVKKMYRR